MLLTAATGYAPIEFQMEAVMWRLPAWIWNMQRDKKKMGLWRPQWGPSIQTRVTINSQTYEGIHTVLFARREGVLQI